VCAVRFWANSASQGPCPACGYAAAEWSALNAATRFSCEGLSTGQAAPSIVGPASMGLSGLASLSASLAITQLIRWRLQLGTPVEDTLVEYCGYTHRTVVESLQHNPA